MTDAPIPLCIDFDGTLTANPLRLELLLQILKRSPANFTGLPLRSELLQWLQSEHRSGRRLVLVVNGNQPIADRVAAPLHLFDDYALVGGDRGSVAERKRSALVARYGEHGFDYAGSRASDQIVWQAARRAIVVGGQSLAWNVSRNCNVEQVFPTRAASLMTWARAIRLHQWVKNLLVLLPALLAHTVFQASVLRHSLLAFLAFGLCASSVYLTNDLFDLAADRAHPRKRARALASGEISPFSGALAALILLIVAASASRTCNP